MADCCCETVFPPKKTKYIKTSSHAISKKARKQNNLLLIYETEETRAEKSICNPCRWENHHARSALSNKSNHESGDARKSSGKLYVLDVRRQSKPEALSFEDDYAHIIKLANVVL